MVTERRGEIRKFILANLEEHPADIGKLTAAAFGISRQTAATYLNRLIEESEIEAIGNTKGRRYYLQVDSWSIQVAVTPGLEEDIVWRDRLYPLVNDLPANVLSVWTYGFTEILNNVVDHSDSPEATIRVDRDATKTIVTVHDIGVGIFNKIQRVFGLHDPRQALLELSKGKLTTDPERHSGEGLFFTSRLFDVFTILSGTLMFKRSNPLNDEWLLDVRNWEETEGTTVVMSLRNDAMVNIEEVMARYAAAEDDYGFTRTHVPIQLAIYEGEQLISRSQAKRILARVDRFKEVILDYQGVNHIGQAFADEIYRVYQREHPEVVIVSVRTTPSIRNMIDRVMSGAKADEEAAARRPPAQGTLL